MNLYRRVALPLAALATSAVFLLGCSDESLAIGTEKAVGSRDPAADTVSSNDVPAIDALLHDLVRYGVGQSEREAQDRLVKTAVMDCPRDCLVEFVKGTFAVPDQVIADQPEGSFDFDATVLIGQVADGSLTPPRLRPGVDAFQLKGDALVVIIRDDQPVSTGTARFSDAIDAGREARAITRVVTWDEPT